MKSLIFLLIILNFANLNSVQIIKISLPLPIAIGIKRLKRFQSFTVKTQTVKTSLRIFAIKSPNQETLRTLIHHKLNLISLRTLRKVPN
jgi:hypothetical protein